jgi:Phosphotransferase enzyme family
VSAKILRLINSGIAVMIDLTAGNAISYLIKKELYLGKDDQSVEITSLSGKNFNLRLQFADGADWLVKQEAMGQNGCAGAFASEWAVQSLVRSSPALAELQAVMPPVALYDRENAILVSRFLTGYQDLADGDRWEGRDSAVAQAIGKVLGQLHRSTFQQMQYRDFLLTIDDKINPTDRPPTSLCQMTPVTPETFGQVRSEVFSFFRWWQGNPAVTAALADLAQGWRSDCLVHQDLKFSNWLWCEATGDLRLIDWELMDWGDPLTDVADVVASYLELWLDSCDWTGDRQIAPCLATATVPLEVLQPSLQQLMRSYAATFPGVRRGDEDWVVQTLRWTGRKLIDRVERLVQYYLPMGQQAAATLQLAQRLLCQPELAGGLVFGCDLATELARVPEGVR